MTEENFRKIVEALDNGYDLQFCFYAGRYVIPARTWARWKGSSVPLIKYDSGGLYLRRGKGYDYAMDKTYRVYAQK